MASTSAPDAPRSHNAQIADQVRALLGVLDPAASDHLAVLFALSNELSDEYITPAARAEIEILDGRNARRNHQQRQRYARKRAAALAKE